MKTIHTILFVSILGILSLTSCQDGWFCIKGEGEIITETLSLDDFSGIEVSHATDVVISQGPVQIVEAEGHGNIIDRLKTNVVNGFWDIDLEKGTYCTYDLTIYITVPDINKIYISGAGDVLLNDFEDQQELELKISGAGKIEMNKFEGATDLDATISGSGKIVGNGAFTDLENLNIKISGSGKYDAYPVITKDCYVHISGAGNCYVHALENLEAKISGAGSVYYKGNPLISTDISGAGNVVNKN